MHKSNYCKVRMSASEKEKILLLVLCLVAGDVTVWCPIANNHMPPQLPRICVFGSACYYPLYAGGSFV